jgi:uncharacterized membrane protein YgdD (TMEM256/DUF423 family)
MPWFEREGETKASVWHEKRLYKPTRMNEPVARRIAAASGFLAVLLGSCGAHGPVHEILVRNNTQSLWQTAVLYHLSHAIVLLALSGRAQILRGPFLCFLAGQILFPGSLYLLSTTGVHWLAHIAPIGGMSLFAGWIWLLF